MYQKECPNRKRNCHLLYTTLYRRLFETNFINVHKQVEQFLRRKHTSTSMEVVFREAHISNPTVWYFAKYTMMDFILLIYNSSRPDIVTGRLQHERNSIGGSSNKMLETITSQQCVLFTNEATYSLERVMNVQVFHCCVDD